MLNFIQKNFIKINLNKMFLVKTAFDPVILRISIVNNIVDSSSADRYINK